MHLVACTTYYSDIRFWCRKYVPLLLYHPRPDPPSLGVSRLTFDGAADGTIRGDYPESVAFRSTMNTLWDTCYHSRDKAYRTPIMSFECRIWHATKRPARGVVIHVFVDEKFE